MIGKSEANIIYTADTKKALKLCFEAHKNQTDKAGMPYVFHPFHVAEQFTGLKGAVVSIEDTIKGFNMIMDGEVDQYPEAAFNLVGTIEEAIEKGKKMLAENKE